MKLFLLSIITLIFTSCISENNVEYITFLKQNNEYKKNALKEELKTFEFASIMNSRQLKHEYLKFKKLKLRLDSIFSILESPTLAEVRLNEINSTLLSITNELKAMVDPESETELAYIKNNLTELLRLSSLLPKAEFRLQLISNFIDSEIYVINYLITISNSHRFTFVYPVIEIIDSGQCKVSLGAFEGDASGTIYIGEYDSVQNENGFTEYFPKQGAVSYTYSNGYAIVNTTEKELTGLLEYEYSDTKKYTYPFKRKLNVR